MPISTRLPLTLLVLFAFTIGPDVGDVQAKGPAYTKVKDAKKDPSFAIQGEYSGTVSGEDLKLGLQIIAMGNNKFGAVAHMGGLPGDGWDGQQNKMIEAEMKDDGTVKFVGDEGTGIYKNGQVVIEYDGNEIGVLKKVDRKSKTLGAKPPKGAIVLFDGTNTDHWDHAIMDGKLLTFAPRGEGKSGLSSKKSFGSHKLHIEFRLPFMPEARGQGRGNSGLYLQSRYEVQMLDSFGLTGKDNECGGIYQISKPKENMCYPPLRWQTYDVEFTAAEYNEAKEVVKKPRMTVMHNGVVIHKDLELPRSTTASPLKAGPEDAPIYLQDHGNPVRYRNIWVVPTATK